MRSAAVVGVGPGIGMGVARALMGADFNVGIFGRREERLQGFAKELNQLGQPGRAVAIPMDVADETSVHKGFAELKRQFGDSLDVLVFNCGQRRMKPRTIMETDSEMFENHWKINCYGAFLCVRQVWEGMMRDKTGTIIMTGATASIRGLAGLSNFSVGKFGLRSLCQTLAAEGCEHNIHVAHVIVDGPVDMPLLRKVTGRSESELISPKEIGKMYLDIINQPPTLWTKEVEVHIPAKL